MRIIVLTPASANDDAVVKLNADGTVAERGHLETVDIQESSAYGEGQLVRFVPDTTVRPQQT